MTYVRGALSTVVKATIGRTAFKSDDGQVVRVEYTDRDFLVLAADLALNGNLTLPERGDRIRETADGVVHTFEVLDWRYSDPYRRTYRLETKLLSSLDAT